jgi:hypothetical protein
MDTRGRNPVTYYPPATQRLLARNREQARGTPYERYFDEDLWVSDDVLPALRAPMDPADALAPADVNALLDPGYHPGENGWCELPDGTGYTASLVQLPGCTGEMYRWWFWWHAVEPVRYTLWYPSNHIAARPVDPSVLRAPGLSDEQRYVGTTHHVDEYIGPDLVRIAITFVDPATLGFDTSRFAAAGIVGHACARVSLRRPRVEVATMVHLARRTPDGIEQRSRYWLGHDPRLRAFSRELSLDAAGARLGVKRRLAGGRVAYEQLLHDQIEFTHLGTFLPAIHAEFGPGTD